MINQKKELKSVVSYVENPKLKLVTVKTLTGKREYKRNCKQLYNIYHIKNIDCVEIRNRWYSRQLDHVGWDERTQSWELVCNMCVGIISMENEVFKFGTFSMGEFSCSIYETKQKLSTVLDYRLIDMSIYEFLRNSEELRLVRKDWHYSKVLERFRFQNQGYNIEQCRDYMPIKSHYDNTKLPIDNSVYKMRKVLGDVTFGLEVETTCGIIPQKLLNQNGVVICKDGSIDYSPEYTTIPLKGVKGLQTIKNLFTYLNHFTEADHSCSYHIHFGNLRQDREFVVALYKLITIIQTELFMMFPYYKRDHRGVKNKNYTKPLTNLVSKFHKTDYNNYIKKSYTAIFEYLNNGEPISADFNRKAKRHVSGEAKWNCKRRYTVVNFINMLFSNRNTVEFRLSTSTTNFTKASNWFMMCLAIVKYATKYSNRILLEPERAITLREILNVLPNMSEKPVADYLYEFYKSRCALQEKAFSRGDSISDFERIEDKNNYEFEAFSIKTLF